MAGLWNLFKIWSDEETLTNEDLNSSFQSIRDNAVANQIEGYSTLNNVSDNDRMDSTVDPFPGGSRDHASSVSGEIERLRYQLASLTGDKWYSRLPVPVIGPKVNFAFPFDGATKEQVAGLCARRGAIAIDAFRHTLTYGTGYDNNFLTVGTGKFSNSGISNYGMAAQAHFGTMEQGALSFWFKQAQPNDMLVSHLGNGLEISVNASGFVVVNMMMSDASSNTAKNTKTITGSVDVTSDSNWHHLIVTWNLNKGSSNDYLKAKLDGTALGTNITGVALSLNIGRTCPFVFNQKLQSDLATRIAAYDSFSPMNLRPDDGSLPAALQFTRSVSGTVSDSVSGGVFNAASSDPNATLSYNQLAPTIGNANPGTDMIEAKIKVSKSFNSFAYILIRDNGNDRTASFRFTSRGVTLYDSSTLVARASVDFDKYRHIEIQYVHDGGLFVALYVDGIRVISSALTSTAGSGSSQFEFGISNGATAASVDFSMEYIGVEAQTASGIDRLLYQNNSSAVKMSDIICFDEEIDIDGVISSNLSSGDLQASMLQNLNRSFYVAPNNSTLDFGFMSDGMASRNIFASVVASAGAATAEVGVSVELQSNSVIDDDGTIGKASSPNSLFGIGSIAGVNYFSSIAINSQLRFAPWYTVVSAINGNGCTPNMLATSITVSEV